MSEEEKNDFAEAVDTPDKSSQCDIKDLYEKVQKDLNNTIKCIDQIKISNCGNPAWTTLQKHASEWQRQAEWASRYSHIYSSLPKYAEIQAQIGNIISNLPTISHIQGIPQSTINAITRTYDAIGSASLSGSLGEYKQNIETAIEAAEDFSNSDSENDTSTQKNPLIEQLKELHSEAENAEEKDLPILNEKAALTQKSYDGSLFKEVSDIKYILSKFLRQFKKITLKNERSSASNACWSKWLAIIAIIISALGILASGGIQWYFAWRSEKNDKTGELIEVVKKSHPWSEQQISSEDAKNVRVAFQTITGALQKNMQLEKDNIQFRQETDRLQTDLRKAQDDLSEFQKKYNADKVTWTQEKQKLYAKITALKKQIKELKTELVKRSAPQSVSQQEAENE